MRDDYSESGLDPGVRRVSILSNGLDRAIDGWTVAAAVVLAGGLSLALVVIAVSVRSPGGPGSSRGRRPH